MIQLTLSDIQLKTKDVCFKCGKSGVKLIHHHIKYEPEIVVFCCHSCHKIIHIKVRKENKCPLTVEETNKISTKLCHRLPKAKQQRKTSNKKYYQRPDIKKRVNEYKREYIKEYRQRPFVKEKRKIYNKEYDKTYYQANKSKIKQYIQRPEIRQRINEKRRERYQEKKKSKHIP